MPQLTCPPRKTLLGWAEGELLPSDSEPIDMHVADCSTCQHALSEEDTEDPLVRALRPVPSIDTSHDRDPTLSEALQSVRRLVQQLPETDRTPAYPNDSRGEPHHDNLSDDEPLDFLDPPTRPDSIGRLGRFHVVERLGSGGVGIVLKALDPDLGRAVALKVLKPTIAGDPTSRHRFLREARAASHVRHPNVCTVHEVGEHNGRLYLAMEFVEGGSLADHLRGTPQPPRQAAALVETLARAIHAAHEQGIVHRDLKPGNILLLGNFTEGNKGNEGVAKVRDPASLHLGATDSPSLSSFPSFPSVIPLISDFGLAKPLDDDATQTKSGVILGTPSYMAPEQAGGKTRDIGPAADIYALGAILYELLTGRPPFRGETTIDTIQQLLADDPVPPRRLQPKVPRDLETVCLKCLEKAPTKRYGAAQGLADDLSRYLAGEPVHARSAGGWERAIKWTRRNPAKAAAAIISALAVLALAVSTVFVWRANVETTRQRNAAQTHAADAEGERARLERDFRNACSVVIHLAEDVAADESDQTPDPEGKRSEIAIRFFSTFLHPDSPDRIARMETAIAYRYMADVYSMNCNPEKAEWCYREAVGVFESLVNEYPTNHVYPLDQGVAYALLGQLLHQEGAADKARDAFANANRRLNDSLRLERTWRSLSNAAWFLGGCFQPEFRDPGRAVELAQEAIGLNPEQSSLWQELGQAQYRAGNYEQARDAWERAIALRSASGAGDLPSGTGKPITLAPDDAKDRFVLAMTYWQLGEKEKAIESYQCGVRYIGRRNQPVEVRWFQAEAAALLGMNDAADESQTRDR